MDVTAGDASYSALGPHPLQGHTRSMATSKSMERERTQMNENVGRTGNLIVSLIK